MQDFQTLTRNASPYHDALPTIRVMQQKNSASPFAGLILPAIEVTHEAVTRSRALVRSLRLLNALQARGLPVGDDVPRLDNLGLPAETIIDPYNGDRLHVKRFSQGWLVYAVGKNLQDDGGQLEKHLDAGVGPPPPAAEPAGK
jgi:hypothetical protein